MDILFLGAGKPASGTKPSALKRIATHATVIDWQIHSFRSVFDDPTFHFLGGYHVEEVINAYPHLNFVVIPDWRDKSVLHTLFHAPSLGNDTLITYSDTIFRKECLSALASFDADIVVGVDSNWRFRYNSRTEEDRQAAETLRMEDYSSLQTGISEFSGLIYLSARVASVISENDESEIGTNLLDLLNYLKESGYNIDFLDVAGHWAELNSPADISRFVLGTKAETLDRLRPVVRRA